MELCKNLFSKVNELVKQRKRIFKLLILQDKSFHIDKSIRIHFYDQNAYVYECVTNKWKLFYEKFFFKFINIWLVYLDKQMCTKYAIEWSKIMYAK